MLDRPTLTRAARVLARRDPVLSKLIRAVGPCALMPGRQPDHLTALVRSIVFQQLSGKAASTIFGRVIAALPGGRATSDPEAWLALTEATLRRAGLSRQKIGYLRDLCERVRDGRLPVARLQTLSDDQIEETVTAVRGFGRWSAHMYMMFHLGRADVWPVDDLGIRKALMRMDGSEEMPRAKAIERRADAWIPYRSVASWYLWRLLDVSMEDIGW